MKISSRHLRSILLLFSLVSTFNLNSQSVAVNVFVPTTPPPTTFQEILSFESDIIFQLTNITSDRLEVKFGMTLTNERRGILVSIVEDYLPTMPINLEAGESKSLRFRNIKASYDNLTENDLILEGIDYESVIRAERLPEGDYELCITVQDYYTNDLLSAEGSCGYFPVLEYEPPIVIYPDLAQTVAPITPQSILFQWTPTGDITKTKYRIQLVNTSDYEYLNPLDVFNHEDEVFIYETDRLRFTQLLYNQNHPILIEGATYAFRVQAYDDNNELNYLNNGWSEPIYFHYNNPGNDPNTLVNDNGSTTNLATVVCTNYLSDISEVLDQNIQAGQILQVNAFEMETTQLQFNAGSESYSGEGLVAIPFLNTTIEVAFTNIKINTENRVFGIESLIYGQVDNSDIVGASTAQNWDSPPDLNFTPNYESHIQSKQSGNLIDLPFRFTDSEAVVVAFLLRPDQAKFKVNLPLSLPEISGDFDPYISFVNNDVCINADGFQESEISLRLSEDVNVPLINNNLKLKLPADENEASMDAAGNYQIDITGELEFAKTIVAYKNKNSKVSIPFTVQNASELDQLIVVNENVSKLIYPGLKDLRIVPEQIIIDLSSNSNASGFNTIFPGFTSLWKGVFIKAGNVLLPNGLGGSNLAIEMDGMALSANGLSLKVNHNQNIINISDGKVATWPFAINEFEVTIEEGELTHGEMKGNLRLPIQSSGKIDYTALLSSSNDNTLNVDMNVQPSDDIKVDMWLATLDIEEASTIGLQKIEGKYKIEADINGSLSVKHNNASAGIALSQINMPSLDFQHLIVIGQQGSVPTINVGAVALEEPDNVQLSIQAFDFTLEDWNIRTEGGRHALNFSLGLSLFGGDIFQGGFGAGVNTELDIWAKYQNGFKLDEVKLNEIEGELDLGIAEAYVKINLYDNDPTFGNGFRGEAGITLARVSCAMEAGFVIQFGKVDGFRYWYFDGHYKNKSGIPLANSGMSLFGFGGGGYYNMEAVGPEEDEVQRYNELSDGNPVSYTNPAESITDFTYEPKKDGRGFRAMTIIGSAATSRAWNVECNLLMDWDKGFNIKNIVFDGKFNMMRDIDDDGDPPLKLFSSLESRMLINVSRDLDDTRTFVAELNTKLDGHFVSASYPMSFMYSSLPNGNNRKWYIHFGSWSKSDPFTDDSRITMSKGPSTDFFTFQIIFKAYFMMGNTYHNGSILPPLPSEIVNASADQYGNGPQQRDASAAADMQNSLNGDSPNTFGIGMGLALGLDFNLDILIFYANFSAEVVTDFALTLPSQGCAGYNSIGFNGWFASGQAYAMIHGSVGVEGKLFGKKVKAHLIDLTAGAAFQVQFPYPKRIAGKVFVGGSIFNGRIKIKPRGLEFDRGEKCVPTGEFNPLENIKYVNEVIPNNNKKNVSVFANPKIALNIPNKEILTFKDIENNTHTYKINYTIRLKNLKNNNLVDISEHWTFNDQAYRMAPENWLKGKTEYEIAIYIKAYEKIGNTFKEFDSKIKKYKFTTGDRPDYIPAHDIVQSYPGLSQRYFMIEKDNGSPITGFLKLNQVECGEILKDVNFNDPQDGYYAVFTNLRTRKKKYVKCSCATSKRIEWEMPQHIAPDEIFRIELLARDFEGVLAAPQEELEETWVGTNYLQANGISTPPLYEQQTFSFTDKNTYTNRTKTKNLLDEKIGWYAQRSKYRSYGEKLDKFSLHQVAYLPHQIGYQNPVTEGIVPEHITTNQISKTFHIPFLLFRPNAMNEPFDQYDLVGYASPIFGKGRIDPILNPTATTDHSWEYAELRDEQLALHEDESKYMNYLTNNAPKWPRPSRYPYYSSPNAMMGLLPRWLRNYKRYERKLSNAGYNVNLWRPAKLLQPEEVNSLIQGHSDDTSGMGFTGSINPTHGSNGNTELQIYQTINPVITTSFTTTGGANDGPDVQGPTGLFTNNSYLPLVDWSSLMMYKDRVHINKHAINSYNKLPSNVISLLSNLNVNGYFNALEELDNRFRNLQIPSAQYKLKIIYQTGGYYDINYQYNRP